MKATRYFADSAPVTLDAILNDDGTADLMDSNGEIVVRLLPVSDSKEPGTCSIGEDLTVDNIGLAGNTAVIDDEPKTKGKKRKL